MLVEELTVIAVAETPPKNTPVRPGKKLVPVILICAPVAPDDGVNELMVGAGYTKVNPVTEKPDPTGLIIVIGPEIPIPATAVIVLSETIVKDEAAVPPK